MTIADLKAGSADLIGDGIRAIYGFKPPEYAVYVTDKRLLVQFADDPTLASEQRKGLAPLNPVRGEINGLIDGWRLRNELSGLRQKAARYDRRVADALVVALEHDVDCAAIILQSIKQDIIDDRTSWARLEYLVSALIISVFFIALSAIAGINSNTGNDLWRASAAGALGAFFSIALNIRSRTILPDLRRTSNITDAGLRVLIGFIGASVLMAFVSSKVVTIGLDDAKISTDNWLFALIVGFLAGFSERLVPDLLAKASTSIQAPPPQLPSIPAAEAGKAVAAGSATVERMAAADGISADAGAAVEDPAPHEATVDHCVCDVKLEETEITNDNELPAATGGVASSEGEQVKWSTL